MRKTLVTAIMCLFAFIAIADTTGRLTGTVTSKGKGPLSGANVKISAKGSSKITFNVKTDKKGLYSQIGLAVGTYVVEASMEGYLPQSAEWKVGLGGATVLDLELIEIPKLAAVKESPGTKDAEQGAALFEEGKHEEAVAAFTRALEAEPDNPAYLTRLGLALEKLNRLAEAEAAFAKVTQAEPSSFAGWFNLGHVSMDLKKYPAAITAFEQAAKVDPNEPETFFNLGSANFNNARIPEAVAAWEKAIQLKPDHAAALYWLGTGYVNLGKIPEAKATFEKFLQNAPATDPNVPQAKLMLDALSKM